MTRDAPKNERTRDPGITSVCKLARKLDPEPAHASQVCRNALSLFDATQSVHNLKRSDRRLLQAAALLHDIGHTVEVKGHHKHSRDLIMTLALSGFSDSEKRIIACVARYHRKAHPAAKHAIYADLKNSDRRRLEKLAALLRIADGLDRCHEASCKRIAVRATPDAVTIQVEQRHPCPTDIWGAQRKQSLFEEVFGVRVFIEASTKPRPNRKVAP